MSISVGDTVILPHGIVGYLDKTRLGTLRVEGEVGGVWDGYDEDDLICANDPLRVRVDTEQEARELVEMAEEHGWGISTNFDHWELSQISCVFLKDGHVSVFCANRDTTCRHGVQFSDRRAQVEAYLEYHSEKETMSDLTHEPKHGDWSYECIHCGEQDVSITEECPEHPDRCKNCGEPIEEEFRGSGVDHCSSCFEILMQKHTDRQREEDGDETLYKHKNNEGTHDDFSADDDDGEPDMICHTGDLDESAGVDDREGDSFAAVVDSELPEVIVREFKEGGRIPGIASKHQLMNRTVRRVLRDHCELSDGVCEWTLRRDDGILKSFAGCRDNEPWPNDWPEKFNGCPFCMKPIEITTDEGGEFDVGHLLKCTNEQGSEYLYVYGIETERDKVFEEAPDYWSYPRYQLFRSDVEGGFTWSAEAVEGDYKRIGSFKPDDDALERVENEPRGELVVSRNTGDVYLYTQGHESHGRLRGLSERGHPVRPHAKSVERTGIVISFHILQE